MLATAMFRHPPALGRRLVALVFRFALGRRLVALVFRFALGRRLVALVFGSAALALASAMLAGCPRTPASRDAGLDAEGSDYDPILGNRFDGPLSLDDARVMRLDPSTLQSGVSPCRRPLLGRVTRVVDGDTFHLSGVSEIAEIQVRMIGIDTPEIAHGSMPADCYGNEAAAFTRQLEDRLVWLTFDTGCEDIYGRSLAYIWIGPGPGDLFQRQLLRRGFARTLAIAPNLTYSSIFEEDRAAAAAARVGLWGVCP
jgi:endonuclease YncB( thermonuclease family)